MKGLARGKKMLNSLHLKSSQERKAKKEKNKLSMIKPKVYYYPKTYVLIFTIEMGKLHSFSLFSKIIFSSNR